MEFSKKIVLAAGIIFALVVGICLGLFVYCTIVGMMYDWTGIVTLLTVSGSVFGTAVAAYANKARFENCIKIKKSFLQEKYKILNDLGVLDQCRAQDEIETEIMSIEENFHNEENTTNEEITHDE